MEALHPDFSCSVCRTDADLEENVEVEPTDLDADADVPSSRANKKESDAAN